MRNANKPNMQHFLDRTSQKSNNDVPFGVIFYIEKATMASAEMRMAKLFCGDENADVAELDCTTLSVDLGALPEPDAEPTG